MLPSQTRGHPLSKGSLEVISPASQPHLPLPYLPLDCKSLTGCPASGSLFTHLHDGLTY